MDRRIDHTLEARTIGKVSARFLPLLIVCYFVAYLDRVNVSFAALTMRADLGLSATAYGLGAGIFFLAYFLFEIPSNLLLVRYGARRWIARIMFSWGLLSGAMAFIGGTTGFYIVRVLLGIAEAGFFPGMIFFLTLWFPAAYRARITGYFMTAIPLSTVIGAPVSGLLLGLDGSLGLKGWQWLFVIEAVPALILALVVLFYLTDGPADAAWLHPDERTWLMNRLEQEQKQRHALHGSSLIGSLTNPKVLALGVVYFGVVGTNYGLTFFLPQIVQGFGISTVQNGFVSALPYLAGVVAMVLWGRRSDLYAGASLSPGVRTAGRGSRDGGGERARKSVDEDARVLRCRPRNIRQHARVLDAADSLPLRNGRCRGDCDDQLDGQPGRFCRSLRDRLDQGCQRQLRGRLARPVGLRPDRHHHRALTRPRPAAGAGARYRGPSTISVTDEE